MHFRKILVPVDFSAASDKALAYALMLSVELSARVEVLHVVTPPPFVPMDVMLWASPDEGVLADIERHLEQNVNDMKGKRSIDSATRVESGVPPDVILSAAEGFDLIVMGTHGRTGLSHLVLGSVAERTLRFAQCPVIVVPGR